MKKNLILFSFLLFIFSCKKQENTKESLMKDFVKSAQSLPNKKTESGIELKKVEQVGANEILMEFQTSLDKSEMEPLAIQTAMTDLMLESIKKNPKNILLINQGVNLRLQLLGKDNKLIFSDLVNKSNINNFQKNSLNEKNANELNTMLEIANSQLPKVDSSGVKITKISLGNNNDVIYTAVVPQDLVQYIKMKEAENIVKTNMSKDQNYKKMLSELKNFGVEKLVYQYRDSKEKLLLEVKMAEQDFK